MVLEGSGVVLEKHHFQRWICRWSNEILRFSDSGGFGKGSVFIGLCYFFIDFGSLYCCETVRWIWWENQLCFNNSEVCIFWFLEISMKKWSQKHDFERWLLRPMSLHFDENPCRFSTILLLRFVKFFEETLSMVVLQAIEKVKKTLYVEQKVRFSRF